jgi:hypothetical protein
VLGVVMRPFDGLFMNVVGGFDPPRNKESNHFQIRKSGIALIRMHKLTQIHAELSNENQ